MKIQIDRRTFLQFFDRYEKSEGARSCTLALMMVLFFVIMAHHPSASASAGMQYTISRIADAQALDVTLQLPEDETRHAVKLAARGVQWGLQDQVRSPRCGGVPLQKDEEGHWSAPPGCQQVTWEVNAVAPADGATDVSSQATVSLGKPRWILLSEPTSLLRPVGDTRGGTVAGAEGTMSYGATRAGEHSWRLPPANNAPEFYVIGDAPVQRRAVGGFDVRYVADDPERVGRMRLSELHGEALRRLTGIVFGGGEPGEADRSLLVIWVGVDAKQGRAGGSAGSRSFVANYVIGQDDGAGRNKVLTLMILSHEQFHQLVDIQRHEMAALPTWVSESLAQYYGLRATTEAFHNAPAAQRLVEQFIDPSRVVEYRFVDVAAMFNNNVDRGRALNLAYRQGATFWAELDRALRQASHGRTDLDGLMPGLLRMNFPSRGGLPEAFLAMPSMQDAQVRRVVAQYVGAGT